MSWDFSAGPFYVSVDPAALSIAAGVLLAVIAAMALWTSGRRR